MAKKRAVNIPGNKLGTVKLMVLGCRCRCGHEWIARDMDRPRVCPKCKSENWDKPKKWEWK